MIWRCRTMFISLILNAKQKKKQNYIIRCINKKTIHYRFQFVQIDLKLEGIIIDFRRCSNFSHYISPSDPVTSRGKKREKQRIYRLEVAGEEIHRVDIIGFWASWIKSIWFLLPSGIVHAKRDLCVKCTPRQLSVSENIVLDRSDLFS